MASVKCPVCKSTTITNDNYAGTLQCSHCAAILTGVIQQGVVANVSAGDHGGPVIEGLPPELDAIYNETRRCMSVKCFTAVELLCRKILMHVAVEKGAKEGQSFVEYLSFLEAKGHVAKQMQQWIDLIRQHGNQATHEIAPTEPVRAEGTLMFTVQLLRLLYEMNFLARKFTSATS